jgi:hypothetical protein
VFPRFTKQLEMTFDVRQIDRRRTACTRSRRVTPLCICNAGSVYKAQVVRCLNISCSRLMPNGHCYEERDYV